MLTRLLGIEDEGTLTWAEAVLRHPWPSFVLLLLIGAAVAGVVWLYRAEHGLTRVRRVTLATLRAAALALLLVVLFEPVLALELAVKVRSNVLVLVDVSESMALADRRTTPDTQRAAAMAMGLMSFDDTELPVPAEQRSKVEAVSRLDLAKAILDSERLRLLPTLAEDHHVRVFTFGETVATPPDAASAETGAVWSSLSATQTATALGAALQETASRFGGQTIAGVIVLSDGASNTGIDPVDAARSLGLRDVPIYPVGLGLPDPPDIALASVIVQETVFAKDNVPVRVQIASTGYEGRSVELIATLNGRVIDRRNLSLTGGSQFEEFTFTPEEKTTSAKLEVTLESLPDEATTSNNRTVRNVRVIDDKIKVLYVEGKPRWEYRYLRAVLMRDRRLDVYFLMTEGDQELAAASDRHVSRMPDRPDELFAYDLIIVGDVPATYFTGPQMELMEKLVRERGGSLLMIAGDRHVSGYAGSPLEPVLAVKPRMGSPVTAADDLSPVVTAAGKRAGVTLLEADPQRNEEVWSRVSPLHDLPSLDGPKPGATVLLQLTGTGELADYPLVAWQRYGSGKSMYVGTDQLWRLRFKRGDFYHARFWGQSIQFLALSRLLGENKRLRVELERSEYKAGQRVTVYAHALTEGYEPLAAMQLDVQAEALDQQAPPQTLSLQAVADTPGLFQGVFVPTEHGRYRLTPVSTDPDAAASAELSVTAVPVEMMQPAMQRDALRQVAEASGGRYVDLPELPTLLKSLDAEPRAMMVRREKELWDSPLVLLVLVVLLGAEWFMRRQAHLV